MGTLGERLSRERGYAEGVAEERARLRALLERCFVFLGDRKGCGRLLADLRRELGIE